MPLLDVDIDIAKKMYDVNVFGVIRATQAFSSLVIAAEGTIVIIGSIAGIMPYAFGGAPYSHYLISGAYNSSKAAVNSIADTLRVEMSPFKVKVINVCTGGVFTNLGPKSIALHNLALPRNSVYLPIESYFKKRQGYSNANAIPAPVYAKQVVSAVNRARRSEWIFRGYFAKMCWFLSTFFWRSIFDVFMKRAFGMNELRKIVELRKKSQ
jgi:1-acylglycerone phosphate reductase